MDAETGAAHAVTAVGPRDWPTLLGGRLCGAASGATLEARNPATGELLGTVPACGPDDVDRAVRAAQEAFRSWRDTHPRDRAERLLEFARRLEERGDELARLDALDNGSPLHEMRKDVALAATQIRYFAGLALEVRGQTVPAGADRLNYTLRTPFGVVGRIIAFNHPLMFLASKLAAPLVAGNTVIMKPSERTSLSALALAPDLLELFPPGVVSVLTGTGAEAGDALVTHPGVRRISFIGSAATGRHIQARAASTAVKTVTLELGGKNPVVVFSDADLTRAVDGVVSGMNFTWQGQSCGSTSRLLVQRDAYDAFLDQLSARIGAMRPGPPLQPTSDTGSLVNEAQLEKVLRYVRVGAEEGARLLTGGDRVVDGDLARGFFVRPALFADVRPDGRLATEEIFGPVLAAMPFDDFDDALRIANSVEYGLTASVFTRRLRTAHAFARDVEAGYVWVNETARHIPGTPFGGVKESGVGREEDLGELESFTELKNVHVRFD
ncbi:MAG: aldehyde dehydrogenase family protein [Kineosporiaceae bacterium]